MSEIGPEASMNMPLDHEKPTEMVHGVEFHPLQEDLKWCAGKSLSFSGQPSLQIKAFGSNVFLPLGQCHATW